MKLKQFIDIQHKHFYEITGLMAIFFIVLTSLIVYTNLSIGVDEGYNLIKATLMLDGYSLYRDIWSDQPPVYTFILKVMFALFGKHAYVARFVTLIFSINLVFCIWYSIYLILDKKAAKLSFIMLLCLPTYIVLSVAIMIGLPAISCAAASLLCIFLWHIQKRWFWIFSSSVFIGISLCIKFFTFPLVPVIFMGLLSSTYCEKNVNKFSRFLPALFWLFFSILTLTFILFISEGLFHLDQLFTGHYNAIKDKYFSNFSIFQSLSLSQLIVLAATFLLNIYGVCIALKNRYYLLLYPFSWFCLNLLIFINIQPYWWHYFIILIIPSIYISAYSISILQARAPKLISQNYIYENFNFHIIAVLIITSMLSYRVYKMQMYDQTRLNLMAEITNTPGSKKLMITDDPFYAFESGINVHPYLAVMSAKRYQTKLLTDNVIISFIKRYSPEFILLSKQRYEGLDDVLNKNYCPIEIKQIRLYRIKLNNDSCDLKT